MPTHAKAIIEESHEFLLLQVVTADWRAFGVNRQIPFVVYIQLSNPVTIYGDCIYCRRVNTIII